MGHKTFCKLFPSLIAGFVASVYLWVFKQTTQRRVWRIPTIENHRGKEDSRNYQEIPNFNRMFLC